MVPARIFARRTGNVAMYYFIVIIKGTKTWYFCTVNKRKTTERYSVDLIDSMSNTDGPNVSLLRIKETMT